MPTLHLQGSITPKPSSHPHFEFRDSSLRTSERTSVPENPKTATATTMTTTHAKNSCTNCRKLITEPPIPIICPNCSEGRDIDGTPSTIRYCSALCLESDTKNLDQQQHHIDDCKARNIRKELYRAGDFLQKVFYIWTEIAFRYDVVRVERVEERIYLSHRSGSEEDEEEDGREEDATGGGGEGPFYAFPFEICKGEDEMKALLSWMACNDAPQMVLELSRKVLGGEDTSLFLFLLLSLLSRSSIGS